MVVCATEAIHIKIDANHNRRVLMKGKRVGRVLFDPLAELVSSLVAAFCTGFHQLVDKP